MLRRILPALLVSIAVVYGQGPVIGTCPVLPANNVWNTPVDTLPVHANSATYVSTIGPTSPVHADFGAGLWDGGPIGISFIPVPASQTKYSAIFTYSDESDPGPYAVPLNVPIEGGSASTGDRHAIAVDTGNCILYELYRAFPQSSTWKADSGAIYNLRSNALRPSTWTSADAAGLPILPGLVRYDEVAAGEIRHAIRFTVPHTLKAFIWPARHYASSLTDPRYPPMGLRFRLKASFDITPYPADVQVILRAMKKYGIILADNGSAWYISGAPDDRWNNDHLATFRNVIGSNFEAVDESSLIVDPNSGEAKQSGAAAVTVSPTSATVITQQTKQFTASVPVTWAVNGVSGGNSQVGYIDGSGLYSAPSLVPSPATVSVQATTVATPAATATATVTIRYPAPIISSVTPNSIPTGAFTLTVNGSGFQSGAVVKLNGTTLSTTFVSGAKLTATGSTATTGSAIPVTVVNPDSQASAAVNIAVTAPAVTISPKTGTVAVRASLQFTANQSVTWSASAGQITSGGRYTAPSNVPASGKVTITAVSKTSPSNSATATVTITRR